MNAYEQRAIVRGHATLEHTLHEIPRMVGVSCADPDDPMSTLVEIGGEVEWVARYLAGLPMQYDVIEPPELVDELRDLGRRLMTANPKRRP